MIRKDEDQGWGLRPLTPEYVHEDHYGYVHEINRALRNPKIRNIALSGNFGVGKSSILQEVADRHKKRVVELSLSTLAPADVNDSSKDTEETSLPEQGKTPTNRIQKEIVKQLLYRVEPAKAPASRFRRIEQFNWPREILFSGVVGLVFALISLVAGWTDKIFTELHLAFDLGVGMHIGMFLITSAVMLSLRRILYGRFHVRQLSTGAATVTLDENSTSYFDQYLDEIFYFFNASGCDVVVFEDIDRFNHSHIFETLLSLNNLLNAPAERKENPIRFIYAIKDSIFDRGGGSRNKDKRKDLPSHQDDAAFSEVERANRTKFFDLVVPVVPFISHQNAKDLAVRLLDEIDHKIEYGVIDVAARHIPDMRLLKNIRNEFVVFRDRVLQGSGSGLGLNETGLFAMMLYKSTHIADFERIRIADSQLDKVYDAWRQLVRENKRRIEKDVREYKRLSSRIESMRPRSVKLGDRLISYVEGVHQLWPYPNKNNFAFFYKGKRVDAGFLRSPEFWEDFAEESGDPVVEWKQVHGQGSQWRFYKSRLKVELDDDLDPDEWVRGQRVDLDANLERCASDLEFLGRADIGQVMSCSELEVNWKGKPQSLDSVVKSLLGGGLAYSLLLHGHINRNFALYSSIYHGDRVSAAAMRFIIHNLDRGVMDEYFGLEEEDVDAVLRERGRETLGEPSFYNIAVLDRLLVRHPQKVNKMLKSLALFREEEQRFVQAYLESGKQRRAFVERFFARAGGVLVHLVEDLELDESDRLEFLDVALGSLAGGVEYQVSSEVSNYLLMNYAALSSLTSARLDQGQIQRMTKVFSKAGVKVRDLDVLAAPVRQSFVENDLYEISAKTLSSIVGNQGGLELDSIRSASQYAYRACLADMPDYLSAVKGVSDTVAKPDEFVDVIEDALESDSEHVAEVIRNASHRCEICRLDEVTSDVWAGLASDNRFPASFDNVRKYIDVFGSIDSDLAERLHAAGAITDHDEVVAEERASLAMAIVSSGRSVLSAEVRVALVQSLDVKLDVDLVPPESGKLFSLLLSARLIVDGERSYVRILEEDWAARELFISESSRFSEYVSPELVGDDLMRLLQSRKVPEQVKSSMLDRVGDYVPMAGPDGLTELAKYAAQKGRGVPVDALGAMAQAGVEAELLVAVLKANLPAVGFDDLCWALDNFGGGYAELCATDGRKVSIPRTDGSRALVTDLKRRGVVASYRTVNRKITVTMKDEGGELPE